MHSMLAWLTRACHIELLHVWSFLLLLFDLSGDCPSSISKRPNPRESRWTRRRRGDGQRIYSSQDAFVPKWGYDTPGHSVTLEHVLLKRHSDDKPSDLAPSSDAPV